MATRSAMFASSDLQRQAANIMSHEFRDPEDVLLFVGQEGLTPPDFAYREALTLDEAKRAFCMLANAEQVDMMWDEDDTWATSKVNNLPPSLTYETSKTKLELGYGFDDDGNEFPLEIANGQTKRMITDVWCFTFECSIVKDLGFLKRLERTDVLRLSSVVPKDWVCCANITDMHYATSDLPEDVNQLSRLRNLS